MRKYELMYIINASLEETQRQEMMENIQNIVTSLKGSVSEVKEMGMRDFAYEIDGEFENLYFISCLNARQQIFKINSKTREIIQITDGDHDITSIQWGDNEFIVEKMSIKLATEIFSFWIISSKSFVLYFLMYTQGIPINIELIADIIIPVE